MTVHFKIGDEVALSRPFLRSTQDYHRGLHRGTITGFDYLGQDCVLATIRWRACVDCWVSHTGKVNVKNLVLKSKIHLEAV
jgi:hypothetical protein